MEIGLRLLRKFLRPLSARARAIVSSTIETSNLRAEVAQSQIREALLEQEVASLSNAMGDTQRALSRIEDYATHLGIALGRIEDNTIYSATSMARMEGTANHSATTMARMEGTANHSATTMDRMEENAVHLANSINRIESINRDITERIGKISDDTIGRLLIITDRLDFLVTRDESARLALDAIRIDQQRAADNAARYIEHSAEQRLMLESVLATLELKSLQLSNKSDEILSLASVQLSRSDLLIRRGALSLGSEVLMRMREGFLLVPADDAPLVTAIWETEGCLEKGTVEVATALLQEGDTAVDVGANVGLLTIPMARRVGPAGRIVAVEASSRIANLLWRSVFLNFGPERVVVHHCAAGREPSVATLNIGQTAGHSSLLAIPSAHGTEQVEVKKLDDLVQPGTRVRLVKIDVEGFEPEVWRGMTRIVSENPELAVIVEFGMEHLHRAHISVDAWLDPFTLSGFSAYEIDETTGTIAPLRMRQRLEEVISLNLLFLRLPISAYPRLKLQ